MTAKASSELSKVAQRPAAADPGGTTPPAAIPEKATEVKELVEKMSKKIKALSLIRQQLTVRAETAEKETSALTQFVTEEILNGATVTKENGLIPQLQTMWRQQDEQNNLTLQHMQAEFQKLAGAANNGSDWEKEKAALIQQHEQELQKARTETTTSDTEIQKVRDEAAAKLNEFKTKVAKARQAEITKLKTDAKTEAAAAAKKILETKLKEQKENFQAQLESVKAEHQLANTNASVAVESSKQEAESRVKELETTLQQLQNEHATKLEQLSSQTESLATAKETAEASVQEMRSSILKMQAEHSKALEQATASTKEAGVAEMDQLKSSMTAELDKTRTDVQQLQATLKEREQALHAVRQELQDAKNRTATESNETNTIQKDHLKLQSAYEQLEQQYRQMREEQSLQNSQSEEQTQSRILDLQAGKLALTKEVETIRRTMEEKEMVLQKKCAENDTLERKVNELQGNSEELSAELASLKQSSSAFSERTRELQASITQLQSEKESLSLAVDERENVKKEMEEQMQKMVSDVSSQKAEVEKILQATSTKLEQTEESLQKKCTELTALESEISGLRSNRDALTDEVTSLKQSRSTAEANNQQISALEASVSQLQQEKIELLNRLEKAQSSLVSEQESVRNKMEEQLQSMTSEQQSQKAQLTEQIEQLRAKLKEAETELRKKGEETETLESKLSDANSNRDALVTEVASLKTSTSEMLADSESLQKLQAAITGLESEKESLVGQLESTKSSFADEREKMRVAMESHVDKMTQQFKAKLEGAKKKAAEECEALQVAGKEKDGKISNLVAKLKALTASGTKMKDEIESLRKRLESEGAKQKSLQTKLDEAQKKVEETAANGSATASSLLKQQETLEKQKTDLQATAKKLKSELSSKSNKVEELSGKLKALSDNMNVLTNDLRDKDEKLELASKLEGRLKTSEGEVSRLREQVNMLKLEQMKNATLVEKLQSEKEANEQSQGERTAIVGMLEGQIADISEKLSEATAKLEATSYDLQQKDEDFRLATMEVEKLKSQLDSVTVEMQRTSEALSAAQKGADAKSSKAMESIQKELQLTKQQMARKSAAAQRLLQQREDECAKLRKTNKELQQEVDKGSYSDRKIFELAALQSNRESQQVSEIELRDNIIERLKEALLERDGDLASAEKHAREIEGQIEELCRIQRREDVNLDYLKSIVVKYLSFPSGSTERAGLLRVLATLLQFDEKDYKTIEEGKNKVSWWGGSVIPTMIAPSPKSGPATTGSAEVSVSTSSVSTSGKPPTSLQF